MSDRHSISVIDFYQQFHCLGASCPKTCCFGWVILVDDDSHAARKREKGLYGLILRIFLKPRKDSFPCIRLLMGHCPHHIHGLCQMAGSHAHDLPHLSQTEYRLRPRHRDHLRTLLCGGGTCFPRKCRPQASVCAGPLREEA